MRKDEVLTKMKERNVRKKEKEAEPSYPIKSFHEFLFDVENELQKFRRVALIGIAGSLFILVIFIRFIYFRFLFFPPILRPRLTKGILLFDSILIIVALVCLVYSIYALAGQNNFLRKWEKRFTQLHALEEKLLKEQEET